MPRRSNRGQELRGRLSRADAVRKVSERDDGPRAGANVCDRTVGALAVSSSEDRGPIELRQCKPFELLGEALRRFI
jgi:hypothetical protein